MKIVIVTPIFPPEIGGPAQYAVNLQKEFEGLGHETAVLTYKLERKLPTGIRHFWFFLRCLAAFPGADFVIALDTFSVAFPAVAAAKLLRKKIIIRTGGDFLWEFYVERTGDLVLLRNFYQTKNLKLNFKERVIFRLTGWTVRNADKIIFSTDWQRKIWLAPYRVDLQKTAIVENYYGSKEPSFPPEGRNFIAGVRPLKWKNDARLAEAFRRVAAEDEKIVYDNTTKPFGEFMEVISHCYAVILVSLGDVSPNMILDAIRYNKPFILTKETGLYDRLKDIGIFVDPENTEEIAAAILQLSQKENYEAAKQKVESFNFKHTWNDIAGEFLAAYYSVK